MIAGRLDRLIDIEQPTETQNDYGEKTVTWSHYATVYAEVVQQSAREAFGAGKIAETDAVFRIRYIDGVTAKMRIVYDDVYYEITGKPREIGRKQGLEIMGKAQE